MAEVLATERIYATVDGKLVREGDERAAFLAVAKGFPVPMPKQREYQALMVTEPEVDKQEKAARLLGLKRPGLNEEPVLIGEREATELADEARDKAQNEQPMVMPEEAVVAPVHLYATDQDGELVQAGDERAARLAYAPGQRVAKEHEEQVRALGDDDDDEEDDDDSPGAPPGRAPVPSKRATRPADKRGQAPKDK